MIVAEIFEKGGPIVWVLLVYSLIALALVFERMLHFILMQKLPTDFERRLARAFSENNVEAYLKSLQGPDARVLQGINQAYVDGIKDLDSVASRYGSEELLKMERGFRTLSILGHTAPLLGLLGTIIGMIKAFMVIEVAGGQVDAQALAGGIWEAMLTTGVGLAVAIPVLLLLHMLESAADKRAHGVRRHAMLLLERLPHKDRMEQPEVIHHREGVIHAV
ncbi:MAG: MotA/TolQ/ExbB proton channel family protein [Gammaproteobacteria bacterium]|nr:MotA/TolQ/ExbB proton channel family protein [Gammaproteobacteria bacterium]